MSCLFSVHQGGQVCSHTSPVLGTARAAHGRGFALDPRLPVPSVPAVTHLLLLCCCPVDSAGAGRHRSVISLSHGSTKCSQTEGAVSDRLGKALGLTQIPGFRVRPKLPRPRNTRGFHCSRTRQLCRDQNSPSCQGGGSAPGSPGRGRRGCGGEGWRRWAGHLACCSRRQCHG